MFPAAKPITIARRIEAFGNARAHARAEMPFS
jgi:hypothetical protein